MDEYTPKLGTLTMEDIVATDAQFAGCYFDGLPEQPIEGVSMKNVTITFDPDAKEGQAAMPTTARWSRSWPSTPKMSRISSCTTSRSRLRGERLRFANVGHFEED